MATPNLPATVDAAAGEYMQKVGKEISKYAARKYDKDNFLKSATIALSDNYQLAEALKTETGRRSLYGALRYAMVTGLSLNPAEGKAALIGYKNKNGEINIQYQIMKNGMVELALDSGKVEYLTADTVHSNDEWSPPSNPMDNYIFRPARKDRGTIDGFFAVMKLKGGSTHCKYMTVTEVEAHRDAYSKMYQFKKEDSPWTKSFQSMGVKTVVKALLRSVSISRDLDEAIATDDFFEADFRVHGTTADETTEKLKADKKPVKPESDGGSLLD